MALSSIGKGIALLSRKSQYGTAVADRIARKLSALDDSKVTALEKQLSFDFSFFSRRPPNADDILNLRRAAILCKETIQGPFAPVDAKGKKIDPTSWNTDRLYDYLTACTAREQGVQPAAGAYMAASFWAFASTQERSAASAGLKEGKDLCVAGLDLIENRRGSTPVRDRCLSLWFGELSEDNLKHVKSVLRDTLGGFNSQPICLHYAGAGVESTAMKKSSGGYVEVGAGWGNARIANPHQIELESKYFSSKETSGPRTTAIKKERSEGMQVSRGGAMLHEATHLYGNTGDVYVPDAVYKSLEIAVPAEGATRAQGYGPYTCHALAKVDPSLAIKNADNYRLFCEDAVIFIRDGKS